MHVPIVYYHSVGGPPPQTLQIERFQAHLDALERHGVETMTVAELLQQGAERAASRRVVLAFDDGLADNLTEVLPRLVAGGHRATFYVVGGHAGTTRWVEGRTGRWSDTRRPGYDIPHPCSGVEDWRALVDAGMEVGCHSWTHRPLTGLSAEALRDETAGAKARLEDAIGAPVTTFCYPKGRVSPRVVSAVRDAGFAGACTTVPGYATLAPSRFLLPRFLVEDPAYFEAVILGRAFAPAPLWALGRTRLRSPG